MQHNVTFFQLKKLWCKQGYWKQSPDGQAQLGVIGEDVNNLRAKCKACGKILNLAIFSSQVALSLHFSFELRCTLNIPCRILLQQYSVWERDHQPHPTMLYSFLVIYGNSFIAPAYINCMPASPHLLGSGEERWGDFLHFSTKVHMQTVQSSVLTQVILGGVQWKLAPSLIPWSAPGRGEWAIQLIGALNRMQRAPVFQHHYYYTIIYHRDCIRRFS